MLNIASKLFFITLTQGIIHAPLFVSENPSIQKAVNIVPSESFTPTSPFHLNYGMYFLDYNNPSSGTSPQEYTRGIQTLYDSASKTIKVCAPYMVYSNNENRFYKETDTNTVTGEVTVVNYVDTWAREKNPQPYITMKSNATVKAYTHGGSSTTLSFNLTPNSAATTGIIYLQDLLITVTSDLTGYDYIEVTFKGVNYAYSFNTTTTTEGNIRKVRFRQPVTGVASRNMLLDERVTFFGQYFLSTVTCSGLGNKSDENHIKSVWSNIISRYNSLNANEKSAIQNAKLDNDYDLAKAIRRYDYILFYKKYDVDDFLSRSSAPNKLYNVSKVNIYKLEDKENTFVITIVAASSIVIISLTTLLIIKMKKRNNSS